MQQAAEKVRFGTDYAFTERIINMKVLYASSEALPFVASGGLGDVAGSLPVALRKRLIGCRVVIPLYDSISQELKDSMRFITHISVPVAWRRQYCGIFEAKHNGVIYYLLDNQYYFKRGAIYGHYDDAERFAFSQGRFWKYFLTLTSNRISFTATTGKLRLPPSTTPPCTQTHRVTKT